MSRRSGARPRSRSIFFANAPAASGRRKPERNLPNASPVANGLERPGLPEKWEPVFRKDMRQSTNLERISVHPKRMRSMSAGYQSCSLPGGEAPCLFQLVRHLGNPGVGALLVALGARAADADGADGLVADLDRHPAAQRNDVGELALGGELGHLGGALGPLRAGAPESARGIGLAGGEFEVVRVGLVRLQEHAQPGGAIARGDRLAVR